MSSTIEAVMNVINHHKDILTIDNFWNEEQCDKQIERSEDIGYRAALVQTRFGLRKMDGIRNNYRVLDSNQDLAEEIWGIAKDHIPLNIGNNVACGLNELLRFYKYEPGQEFKKHKDGRYSRNESESSFYTFMIYLNDDFKGGETIFENGISITPSKGTCLVFLHDLEHEGAKVVSGTKYVLRTDIMYKVRN